MEYDDSNTVIYVLAALVLAAGIWFFAIRERPSSDMQFVPPVPEQVEPAEAPAAGPLDPTLDWPDAPEAPDVEGITEPDVTQPSSTR